MKNNAGSPEFAPANYDDVVGEERAYNGVQDGGSSNLQRSAH